MPHNLRMISISALSKLSAVSVHTIRAWERRYGALKPKRGSNGFRSYGLSDLERIRSLSYLVNNGHSIGNIAKLDGEQLTSLRGESALESYAVNPVFEITQSQKVFFESEALSVLSALANLDFKNLNRELLRARVQLNVPDFIFKVVAVALREVGAKVGAGEMSVAQEHSFSSVLRDHLGQIFQMLAPLENDLISAVVTTPEGDFHEFGALLAAILCRYRGIKTYYLGASMPVTDLLATIKAIGASIVIVGAKKLALKDTVITPSKYLNEILRRSPSSVEVWSGGDFEVSRLPSKSRRRVRHFRGFDKLDAALVEIGLIASCKGRIR